MKKLFTSLFILTLIVSLLCSAPVMAIDPLSFVYSTYGQDIKCDGTDTDNSKGITNSDFHWSGFNEDHLKMITEDNRQWTGVAGGITCCTRNKVNFAAATYEFRILSRQKDFDLERTLPQITFDGGSTYHEVSSILVAGDATPKTPTDNKYTYPHDVDVTLIYNITIASGGDKDFSVYFPTGEKERYLVRTLTITTATPVTPTYDVTVNNDGNGTASADKAKYEAGETVTLTAEPNANYVFNGWTTSDGVSFVDASDASTTFTMPAQAVTVQANFVACSGQTVTVSVNNGTMGSATGGGSYCAGAQVDLVATANSGYRFVEWEVTSGSATLDDVNRASTHFTMSDPAAAVTVQANFEYNPCTNTKTVQCVSGYVPVTIYSNADPYVEDKHETYVVTTHDNASAYYYPLSLSTTISSFTLSIHMANSQNNYAWFNLYKKTVNNSGDVEYGGAYYNKVGWQHMVSSGSWNSGEFDDAITSFADGSEGVGSSIPSGDYLLALSAKNDARFYYFTLTANTAVFCPNTITMQKSGDASAADPTSSPASAAMAGTVVTVTAGAPSDASHYFVNWTASPSVEFVNANASSTTFVMPAEDVTITANYGAVVSSEFTYTVSGEGTISCETESGSSVVSGTEIEMTAAVTGAGCVFRGWTATVGTFSDATALTTTFTMPAEAATVTATFAQVDNIICYGVESGSAGDVVGGGATISGSNIQDFDAFDGNNIVKLSYEGMSGSSAYASWDILKGSTYNSANSAGATGFGFYYKTEAADDNVAMWFEPNTGDQQALQLNGTSNVWKYVYFAHSAAATWNQSQIRIYINGEKEDKSTANANGAIYLADIAATSITSKPDIDTYIYTRDISGAGWGTLCLPMDGAVEGATLFSVAGKQEENSKLYVVLQEEPTLVGGQPYIFEKTADELRATMSGPQTPSPATVNGLVGTYVEISSLTPYDDSNKNYILAKNGDDVEFQKVGDNVTVGEYRAYMNLDGVPAYSPSQAIPGRRYVMMGVSGTQETEDTEDISAVEEVESGKVLSGKILVNGQLYLMYEGKMYDVRGARVK